MLKIYTPDEIANDIEDFCRRWCMSQAELMRRAGCNEKAVRHIRVGKFTYEILQRLYNYMEKQENRTKMK